MQNLTVFTQPYPTIFYEDYIWNDLINTRETHTADAGVSETLNVHRVVWPAVFTALVVGANLLSLVAFSVEKRLRTYNNYFIILLCILDLLVGVSLIITVVHTYLGYYPFSIRWCRFLQGGFNNGVLNASNLSVVAICFDRHRATFDPLNHFVMRSKRKAVVIGFITSSASLFFWMGYVVIWEFAVTVDDDTRSSCTRIFSRSPIPYVVLFYLPVTIISVLYLRIFLRIRKILSERNIEIGKNVPMMDKMGRNFDSEVKNCLRTSQITVNTDLSNNTDSDNIKNVCNIESNKNSACEQEAIAANYLVRLSIIVNININ